MSRDLGLMGESTFSLWCADVGLIPNGSQIDKTGWDFFVEFPFSSGLSPHDIHKPAFECKVQVKATDKSDRKLPITLANLRRLITAQMPSFFVFIEFDGKNTAQRAYVVHVDNELITKVLKRLHEIEQSNKENNFNKRKMTIHYDESNLLDEPNGKSLKRCFSRHIGEDVAEYISNKKRHLESTGYENGFAQITFTTEGEDNLKTLMDMSLGIETEVELSKVRGVDTRFGILSKNPSFDSGRGAKLSMPNLVPKAEGKIRFRENMLSSVLSFDAKVYVSPFNAMVPDELKKMRVEGELFDFKLNPYTGSATYSFSFGEGIRLEVRKFRDAIQLMNLLSSSGKKVAAELITDELPKFEFFVGCKDQEFDFSDELKALNSAVRILSEFDVTELVDITFDEITKYQTQICQLEEIFRSSPGLFRIEFGVEGGDYDSQKETVCLFLITAPVGSHIFGVILSVIGSVENIDGGRFRLIAKEIVVEQKIVSEKDGFISNEDLVAAIESIEHKYDDEYSVVTFFDKKC